MNENKLSSPKGSKQGNIFPIKLKIVRNRLVETWIILVVGFLFIAGIIILFAFILEFFENINQDFNIILILVTLLASVSSIIYLYYINKLRILLVPKLSLNTVLDDFGIDIDTHSYHGFIRYDQIKDVKYLGIDYSIKELDKLEKLKNSIKIEFKKPLQFKDREGEVHKLSSLTLEILNAESIVELIRTRIE